MHVLVTGATGFIGSRVMQQLLALPDVRLTWLTHGRDPWRFEACGVPRSSHRVVCLRGDFAASEGANLVRAARPEVLIHLGMVYHILGSGGGSDVLRVNYEGTVRLFEAFASAGGRRFIGAGTCFEYGHQQAGQIHEDTPCTPIYDYAIAKARATETVLDRAARQGVEAALLRVFSPYGTMEDPQRLIPQLFRAARAESPLDMTPGEQVRDYTLVDDVAAAFVAAATAPLACPQRVFNVCSGIGHTVRQVADAVGGALGRPVPVRWGRLPYRPNEMMRLVGCPRRIQAELGWRALWSLEDGLRRSATAASRVA